MIRASRRLKAEAVGAGLVGRVNATGLGRFSED